MHKQVWKVVVLQGSQSLSSLKIHFKKSDEHIISRLCVTVLSNIAGSVKVIYVWTYLSLGY